MRAKTKTCAKVATLAALAAASSVVTSMVMTRVGQARAGGDPVAAPRTAVAVAAGPAHAGLAPQGFQPGRGVVASGLMRLLAVEAAGDTVHVAADAFLHDTRPGMRFVWAVRVLDPADARTVLYEKLYDDQAFDLLGRPTRSVTFEDRLAVPLKPGKYRLELTWFGVHPRSGLAGLNDPVLRREYQGLSALVPITLGP